MKKGRREEGKEERKEKMEGDLWALLASVLPSHKPVSLDYKTGLLFKGVLFFYLCVVRDYSGGAD